MSPVDALTEGLALARLHHVAKAVQEQRAQLDHPSHALYVSDSPAIGEPYRFTPIYATSPGMHGARRCVGTPMEARPRTPSTP